MQLEQIIKANLSHEERTATEPRNDGLHPVVLSQITLVNERIKMFRFYARDERAIKFRPGQWVDLHVPGIPKAGGFTITSAPYHSLPLASPGKEPPYIDLAVQKSPENPPAAWLWQPSESILGTEMKVRIGGSFVYPPHRMETAVGKEMGNGRGRMGDVTFIAGGVGINPLIAMLEHICLLHGQTNDMEKKENERERDVKWKIRFLYSTKIPSKDSKPADVLFLAQIQDLMRSTTAHLDITLELFVTGTWDDTALSEDFDFNGALSADAYGDRVTVNRGRIGITNLHACVGAGDAQGEADSLFYVCGPPRMTDSIVEELKGTKGVRGENVLCEKWW